MKSSETSIGLFHNSDQFGEDGPDVQTERLRYLTSELGRLGTRISVKKFTECKDGINPNGLVKKESSVYIFPPQEVSLADSSDGRHEKLPDGTIKEFESYSYDPELVAGKVEIQYHVENSETASLLVIDRMTESELPHEAIVAIDQAFEVDA